MHTHVLRLGRRIAIAIVGALLVLAGLVLSVPLVPGPGLAIVVLGLAVLSLEFERPRLWLAWLKARGIHVKERVLAARARRHRGS